MSARRLRLENPFLVGAVALGLVCVTVLNVWMFRSGIYSLGPEDSGEILAESEGIESVRYLVSEVDPASFRNLEEAERTAGFRWPSTARDPFQPQSGSADLPLAIAPPAEAWRCEAVILSGPDPVALINGAPYRIGDSLKNARIAAIDRKGVLLLEGKKEIKLSVSGEAKDEIAFSVVMAGGSTRQEDSPGPDGLGDQGGK